MSQTITPVAPILIPPNTGQRLNNVLDTSTMLNQMYSDTTNAEALEVYHDFDNKVQDLVYVAYPDHIKPFVSKTHTAMDCLQDSVRNAAAVASNAKKYTASRHRINALKQQTFRSGARDMVKAAFDTETITLTDPVTKKTYSRIMEFGVTYSTAGQASFLRKDLLDVGRSHSSKLMSSGLIGVDNVQADSKELRKLMDAVGEKIRLGQSLNKEERLVAQFVSRLGDSDTQINRNVGGKKWYATVENLTKKSESEYLTSKNYEEGKKLLYELGDSQYVKSKGTNKAELRFIDNLAYMASNNIDFVEGKNIERFDLPIIGQTIFKNQEYLKYYRSIIGNDSALPISDLLKKSYDLDAMSRQVSGKTMNKFILEMFKGHPREQEIKHFMKQEKWAKMQGLSDLVAHFAAGDAYVLSQISNDPNSAATILENAILNNADDIYMARSSSNFKNFNFKSLDGMIINAKTTGSPGALEFNNDIFGYVKYNNGNVYYSDATMYNAAKDQHFTQKQYIRSLWNKDTLYDIVSSEVIDPDKIEDPRVAENKIFAGQRVLHMQMRLHKPYEDMPDYENYMREIHVFVPEGYSEEEFFNNFAPVAYTNSKGNLVMTDYGRKIPHDYVRGVKGFMRHGKNFINGQAPFTDQDLAKDISENMYTDMAEMKLRDSAERALTKYTPTSMDHVFEYQKLLDDGVTTIEERNKQLIGAITKAAMTGDDTAYQELNKLTGGSMSSTKKLVNYYIIDNEFNSAWLRNTAEAAKVMEKGSLLEQLDAITRKTIKAYKKGKYTPEQNGDLYSLIMQRMTKFVLKNKDIAQIDESAKRAMIQYRLEDQQGRFFVNMEHYLKKFSIGTPYLEEETKDRFLEISLDNTNSTINRILSMNKIPKADRESNSIARRTILDTIEGIAESPEARRYRISKTDELAKKYGFTIKKDEKDPYVSVSSMIKRMLTSEKNLANERNAYDLMQDVVDMFKTVRRNNYWAGTRATDFEPVLSSMLVRQYGLSDEQLQKFTEIAEGLIQKYDQNGNGINITKTGIIDNLKSALIDNKDRVEELTKEGSSYYANYLADQRYVLAERMRLDLDALNGVNKTLADLVHDSGGQLTTMPGNRIMVKWGGANTRWEDISDKLIHIETNEAGAGMFKFGPGGTLHQARGVITFGKNDAFELEFKSAIDYAHMRTGVAKGTKAYQKILDDIERGVDPRQAIERGFLSPLRSRLQSQDLAANSVESNVVALMSADLSPLFYAKKMQKKIGDWENYFKNDPVQLERIENLKIMIRDILENGKSEDEAVQFAQKEGLIGLLINSNSPFYIKNGMTGNNLSTQEMFLQASAYEKSGGLPIGIASPMVGAENFGMPGKQVGKFITHTAAFNAEQNLPADSRIIMAPGIMSQAEKNLAVYTEKQSGKDLYKISSMIQVPLVEANPHVKEKILDQIRQLQYNTSINTQVQALGKYDRDKVLSEYYGRAARIVNKRMNLTEGGALANGYLLDQLDMPAWGSRVVALNGRRPQFRREKDTKEFLKNTAFTLENGVFSYGKGYSTKYDENYVNFVAEFGSSEAAEYVSSGPSYATVEYVTREGNVPMSEKAVTQAVEKLSGKKAANMELKEFEGYADQIFKKAVVNHSYAEQGHYKWFVEFEKGVGATTTAFLGNLLHDDEIITALKQLEATEVQNALKSNVVASETLLYNIINDKAWNVVQGASGVNFRGSVALSKSTYAAIQNLDFTHPIFNNISDENLEKITNSVYQHMINAGVFGSNATMDSLTSADKLFAKKLFGDFMSAYRNSINDPLFRVTDNAYMITNSLMPAAKHGNSLNLLNGTVQFIREDLMKKNNKKGSNTFLREAIKEFDKLGALTDEKGNLVKLSDFLSKKGDVDSVIIPNFITRLNEKAIEDGLVAAKYSLDEWEKFLGTGRNLDGDTIKATMGTLGIIVDDANSLKTLKLTDREISGLYSTLWDEESLKAVTGKIEEDFEADALEKKFFSKYSYLADAAQKNRVAGEQLIDYIENDLFFSRFGLNTYGKINENGRYGSSVMAAKIYNPKLFSKADPYRQEKTEEIVKAIKNRLGNNRYLAQSAVDDLYVATSEQVADEFNRLRYKSAEKVKDLVTDRGRNNTGVGFFKETSIKDITLFKGTGLGTQMKDPMSDLRKNTIWNMTDADIGLTESVLGQNSYIAVAGVNEKQYKSLDDMFSANKQQSLLNRISQAREDVKQAYDEDMTSSDYKEAVEKYKKLLTDLNKQVHLDAMGKEENSTIARLTEMYAPASVSGKVQVTDTVAMGSQSKNAKELLEGRYFKGKSLAELAEKGTNVNYMIIGEDNLASMGFNKQYFKMLEGLGISKEEWLKNAKTNGIAGIGHRWPSIYWGSDMAVQVYIDSEIGKGVIHMDAITAAAMKADADGDRAQAMLLGATQKNGAFLDSSVFDIAEEKGIDLKTKSIVSKIGKKKQSFAINSAEEVMAGHSERMLHQMYYDNAMFKVEVDTAKALKESAVELLKKKAKMDLYNEQFIPTTLKPLTAEEAKNVGEEFMKYQGDIVTALENIGNSYKGNANYKEYLDNLQQFRAAKDATSAFTILSEMASSNKDLKNQLSQNITKNRKEINNAYINAYKLYDADVAALQRVARGGAGVIDNPFTAAEMVRLELLETKVGGKPLLSAEESFAIQQMRTHIQEEFLTPKQMTPEGARSMGDLTRVTELIGNIFNGKIQKNEREELVGLLKKHARPLDDRHQVGGMLKHFVDANGKLDDTKLIETGLTGLEKTVDWVNNLSKEDSLKYRDLRKIFSTIPNMVSIAHSRNTNIAGNRRTPTNIVNAILKEASGDAIQLPSDITNIIANAPTPGRQRSFNRKAASYGQNIIRSGMGGGWSKNVMLLAGAIMLTGFVGGNPATPAEKQADQRSQLDRMQAGEDIEGKNPKYYEQDPYPSNIQLADPSLSPSGRKQPGYVININAQTQRDKDYASRVITQAVTQNYHNTNVNVSMNVNQQPGNISGKEIADYIRQAF